jgi:hypothetical protein
MNTSTADQAVQWLFLDLNAFFASCEQQDNPALRGQRANAPSERMTREFLSDLTGV